MLTIENKDKLNGEKILSITTDGYYVDGVYEYEDYYQIHITSNNKTIPDENFILQRIKSDKFVNFLHSYYTLYNSNEPQRKVNLTIAQIKWKDMFLHNIELILKMNN
jgi:hypothetical protein